MSKQLLFALMIMSSLSCLALEPGDMAPGFANPDQNGVFHFSKNYLHKGWVLLDFFATWCDPCIENLPHIIDIEHEYASMGLTTILFAVDSKGPEVVGPFFEENPVDILVLIDRYQMTLTQKYGESSIPQYFLIDDSGVIRYKGQDIALIRSILSEHLSP